MHSMVAWFEVHESLKLVLCTSTMGAAALGPSIASEAQQELRIHSHFYLPSRANELCVLYCTNMAASGTVCNAMGALQLSARVPKSVGTRDGSLVINQAFELARGPLPI